MATQYKDLMKNAGIPTTDAEIENSFKAVAQGVDTDFYNDDKYSPFWSLFNALCVYPAKVLVKFIYESVLPNLYIKDAKEEYLDTLGWAYETPRKAEAKTKGFIKFVRHSGSGTQSIAAGTVVQSSAIRGVVYKLQTVAEAVFEDGEIEKAILCEALTAGAAHNLAAGFYNILPESLFGIKKVYNDESWITVNGADKEDDEDYRMRLRDLFGLLNHYHVDEVYRSIITSFTGISPKNVFLDRNTPRGPGSADALILMDYGSVSAELLTSINKHIRDDGNHGIGDDILVRAIDTVNVDLNIQIYVDSTLTAGAKNELKLQFENYIKAAFRQVSGEEFDNAPNKVEPFKRFSFSRLGYQAHKEFSGLISIDFNSEDLVHNLNISKLNLLTVSMIDAN